LSVREETGTTPVRYTTVAKTSRTAPIKRKPFNWKLVQTWTIPVLFLVFWQVGSKVGWIPHRILPAPTSVFSAGVELWRTGALLQNIEISSARAFAGLAIGGSIGFALGLINGVCPLAEGFLDSAVQMFRTIPSLALIPLVILWLGIGEEAKVSLVALGVFFPLYLNTYHGIKTVDVNLKEMGRVYGLGPWALFRRS